MEHTKKKTQKQTEVRKIDTCDDTVIMAAGNTEGEPTEQYTGEPTPTASNTEQAAMVDKLSTY